MRFTLLCSFVFLLFNSSIAQKIEWSGNTSPDYISLINYYKQLAKSNKRVELYCMGNSDYGLPIFLCIINGEGDSLATFTKAKK